MLAVILSICTIHTMHGVILYRDVSLSASSLYEKNTHMQQTNLEGKAMWERDRRITQQYTSFGR